MMDNYLEIPLQLWKWHSFILFIYSIWIWYIWNSGYLCPDMQVVAVRGKSKPPPVAMIPLARNASVWRRCIKERRELLLRIWHENFAGDRSRWCIFTMAYSILCHISLLSIIISRPRVLFTFNFEKHRILSICVIMLLREDSLLYCAYSIAVFDLLCAVLFAVLSLGLILSHVSGYSYKFR